MFCSSKKINPDQITHAFLSLFPPFFCVSLIFLSLSFSPVLKRGAHPRPSTSLTRSSRSCINATRSTCSRLRSSCVIKRESQTPRLWHQRGATPPASATPASSFSLFLIHPLSSSFYIKSVIERVGYLDSGAWDFLEFPEVLGECSRFLFGSSRFVVLISIVLFF